jgi:hypothetical protein
MATDFQYSIVDFGIGTDGHRFLLQTVERQCSFIAVGNNQFNHFQSSNPRLAVYNSFLAFLPEISIFPSALPTVFSKPTLWLNNKRGLNQH